MVRAGLILGGVMLVLGGVAAFVFPPCVPCLALFAGPGAGYLAGLWDRPTESTRALGRGAGAGAMAGAGAWLAHIVGGLGSAAVVGPEQALEFSRALGLNPDPAMLNDLPRYYGWATGTACCFGVFEIVLMAMLGVVGGLVWWQLTGKNQSGPSSALSTN